ncbi:L-amino acid N-acyltransferase YncA [Microcella putealis]|uniref:L-amino acid N-acyltransferase YncA n=1 Tax=Microcella putealis TaxID=337005 RepID=A0A4Q7LQJ1_9MICO|nr:GNAT family N-acetyltransferase [Microcella putealis]RZS56432.1 L-amino acid N-acyltransferase YncA [Microcella putealis]TQM27082.1 L-amino acid N-acyltransferase YncA [Microcella putealis]
MPPLIRFATAADIDALAELHIGCFAEVYAGVLSERFLAANTVETARAEWASYLSAGDAASTVPGSVVLLAEDRDPSTGATTLVGLARSAPTVDPEAPRDTKLDSLYTRRSTWGTGLGSRLLDGVLGDTPAYLWIVTSNARAARFYEKHGFALDGFGRPYEPWDGAHCSRMVR